MTNAPNVDKPNEGIIGQISNSIGNAANYVSESELVFYQQSLRY